jgi:hypothetical protein
MDTQHYEVKALTLVICNHIKFPGELTLRCPLAGFERPVGLNTNDMDAAKRRAKGAILERATRLIAGAELIDLEG